MKKLCFIFVLLSGNLFSQGTGTAVDPFLILGQALTVPSAGIYYFNLGGTTFSTYVDASGYVQVARDFGNGTGNLPQGTALNSTTRGILSTTALSTLSGATDVKITSSGGSNVITTNATIISRLSNNQTLHQGSGDNGINNGWTGTNAGTFTGNATCVTSSGNSLHQNIFHPCGNASTFHWMPSGNYQRDPWNLGEVANTASFALWVRDNSSPLPIELLDFGIIQKENKVDVFWSTASERNNDFFQIERTKNGSDWETVAIVNGAGNSEQVLEYSVLDMEPFYGLSYYRLKQVDFDGEFSFSEIESVVFTTRNTDLLSVFPNPTNSIITVQGVSSYNELIISNSLGKTLSISNFVVESGESWIRLNLSSFDSGVYFISDGKRTVRVSKY